MAGSDSATKERIEKDIQKFYLNIGKIEGVTKDGNMLKIVDLSRMYASDAKSYLSKGDLLTAFSCISYAHGLLDAILKLNGSDGADVQ
ncbi:MAG: DUF357 domain-containing protein [Candidatus Micrarchaeales archaeon]|nr:DUF357 domain-containing protein [Candidatus Micrarchaeales archaeon]